MLSNRNLGQLGLDFGLAGFVLCNPGTYRVSPGMMATVVEAMAAALHVDGGDAAVDMFMELLNISSPMLNAEVTYHPP